MGWLELIALMKRVLPLLSRVAPMLETYMATRGATRGDAEALDRLSGDLKAHTAAAAQNHAELTDAIGAHSRRLQQISEELQRLRDANTETLARLESIGKQASSTSAAMRIVSLVGLVLLLACVGLLTALLLRR